MQYIAARGAASHARRRRFETRRAMRIYRPMAYLMMRKRTLTARPVSPFAVGLATSL
jgi:hypothetical protein